MSSIDERIVKMRFDNSQFEQGVTKTTSLLDKLKTSFNLDKSVESIGQVDKAVSGINFNPLTEGLKSTQSGFNAMGAVAFSVLNRMTNAAIDAGTKIASALTQSARDGFAEYETQMGSIQTILSNTSTKGTNLDQVNRALNTLNTYADKTIYNFTEMTRNIGMFTAAGVDLQTSVDSIKGISNLAAASGSSADQASTAMYQLSQAIAAGKIQLMDWNSVVNAGMGGELFQNALKRTAEHFGTDVDAMIKKYGSFRESLTKGDWLTTDVLTETLKQISGAYSEADLKAQGYTDQQAKDIVNLAKTAEDAATKVKTFTQLIDTTKEALGSGWTQSWQIIIGDFEESKDLWSGISDSLNKIISTSSNARNELLTSGLSTGWKQLLDQGIADTQGFQDIMTQTAREHGVAIDDMINQTGSFTKSMSKGWVTADIVSQSVQKMTNKFSAMSTEELKNSGYTSDNVDQLRALNEKLQNGSLSAEDFAEKMNRMSGRENVISGLTNVFTDLGKVFERIGKVYREVFPAMTGDELYKLTERFKDLTNTLTPSEQTLDRIGRIAKGVFSVFDIGAQVVKAFGDAIATAFGSNNAGTLLDNFLDIAARFGDWLVELDKSIRQLGIFDGVAQKVGTTVSNLIGTFNSFTEKVSLSGSAIKSVASTIGDSIGKACEWVKSAIDDTMTWISKNISAGDIFAGLAGGGIFTAAKKIASTFNTIKEAIDGIFGKGGDKLKQGAGVFEDVLSGLGDSLKAFTDEVKAATLLEISGAIAVLVHSIETMAALSGGEVTGGVIAIGALMAELNISLDAMIKSMKSVKTADLIKTGLALMAFSKSIEMLASAMDMVGRLDLDGVAKGLAGIGGAMAELVAVSKALDHIKLNVKTAASLVIMAQAVKMVAEPLEKLGGMSWDSIAKGLSAMGGALTEMGAVTGLLGRFGGFNIAAAVSVVITAKSLSDIASAFDSFAKHDWGEVGRGLVAMGGALGEVGLVTGALGELAGISGLIGAGSILLAAQGLGKIASAFDSFSKHDWGEVGRGLVAMGGALTVVGAVSGALGMLAGIAGLIGSGSILLAAQGLGKIASAFDSFSKHDWGEVGRGLVAMGGALAEVGAVSGALGALTGIAGLIGAGSILLAAQGLEKIASAFAEFTKYDWDEIGRGLVAMGGALTEVGAISGALGMLTGISGILGAGTIVIAAQGLGQVASIFDSFTKYDWDEIGRGLVAMGGAMAEVGAISGATGALTGIAGLVGAGTIALASQGLGTLADTFGKFAGFNWDEIGRGLTAMAGAMGATGLGALLNTFSGFGANAISTVAAPLGTLADSMKKWQGITIPDNLAGQLGSLADGIMKFTFGGWGSSSIATVAKPLGDLAVSLGKWSNLTFPDGIGDQLGELSHGIMSFTFAFAGGWSLSAVVGPFGDLADSVKKWNGVKIPADIETGLSGLAKGVEAFSFAFLGGWSIDAITGPFGDFAGAVKKWNGVKIPADIQDGLTGLAKGINAFAFSFLSGWSLSAITGPFGDFAGAVKKWNRVSIPADIQDGLTGLAKGIAAFSFSFVSGWSLSAITGPLGDFAGAVKKWNGVSIPDGIGSGLTSLATGVNAFSSGGAGINPGFASLPGLLDNLATSVSSLGLVGFDGIGTSLTGFASTLNGAATSTAGVPGIFASLSASLGTSMSTMSTSVSSNTTTIGSSFTSLSSGVFSSLSGFGPMVLANLGQAVSAVFAGSSGISSGSNSIISAFTAMNPQVGAALSQFSMLASSMLSGASMTILSMSGNFNSSGRTLTEGLLSGLRSNIGTIPGLFTGSMDSAAASLRSYYGSFCSAGSYVASGFVKGISDNISSVAEQAAKLAKSAVDAAKALLGIHSPSRVFDWMGQMSAQGFINSMDDSADKVLRSGSMMAQSAVDGFNSVDLSFGNDFDSTIRPVMDLSMIKRQTSQMSSMIDGSIDPIRAKVDYIGSLYRQNGGNSMDSMLAKLSTTTDQNTKELSNLRNDMAVYTDAIQAQEISVSVDGKKLASTIAKPMNRELGIMSRRGGLART